MFLRETARVLPWLEPAAADLRGPHFETAASLRELDQRMALALSRPGVAESEHGGIAAIYNERLSNLAGRPSPWAMAPRPPRLAALETDRLSMTPTRLQTFAACAFRHFARFEMGIDDPHELAFGAREDGTLLDHVATTLLAECRDAGGLKAMHSNVASVTARMRELLEQEIGSRHGGVLHRPLWRARVPKLEGALERFAECLWQEAEEGEWQPEFLQLSFGAVRPGDDPASKRDPLMLRGEGIELRIEGRLDRADRAVADPEVARVLDYKRSSTPNQARGLREGRLLQIPLYRLALERLFGKRVVEAGHFHFKGAAFQDLLAALRRALKSDGNGDSQLDPSTFTEKLALELARRMASGAIEVKPLGGECARCPYGAVCRVDRWYRLLRTEGEAEFTEGEADGGDE